MSVMKIWIADREFAEGAPLLALFEKWAATETDTATVLVLRSRRSNHHLQHFPLVHFHLPRRVPHTFASFANVWASAQTRFYNFNVWTDKKRLEKLRYMNSNPVK